MRIRRYHKGELGAYLPHRMVGSSLFGLEIPDVQLDRTTDPLVGTLEYFTINPPFFALNRRGEIKTIHQKVHISANLVLNPNEVKLLYLFKKRFWNIDTADNITDWELIAPLGFFSRHTDNDYVVVSYGNGMSARNIVYLPAGKILTPWGVNKPRGMIPRYEFSGIIHGHYYDSSSSSWKNFYGTFTSKYDTSESPIEIQWFASLEDGTPLGDTDLVTKGAGVPAGTTEELFLSNQGSMIMYSNFTMLWYYLLREFYVRGE